MKPTALPALLLLLAAAPLPAAELKVLPAEVPLSGPAAGQRLLVLTADNGRYVADRTAAAKFSSSNPAVAKVDEAGHVSAVGDGEAVVTVSCDGMTATATVRVSKSKEPFAPSFRSHVEPLMTKVGCNSGACHGALAGKGGLKLSLRGYDPDSDHFVLTRQALSRRVDRTEPARSLMLLKPTRTLPHAGGKRFDKGSYEYE